MMKRQISTLAQKICHFRLSIKAFEAVSEDFRKVGSTMAAISVAGLVLPNDELSAKDSFFLFVCSMIVWLCGILFTHSLNKNTRIGDIK
ncbi:hypothetical protein [Pasteurella testudinis]|uniref:hypothetical protein n=1 Tax=Pasteurella testudinis TaxID=761 RepID=UPI00405A2768